MSEDNDYYLKDGDRDGEQIMSEDNDKDGDKEYAWCSDRKCERTFCFVPTYSCACALYCLQFNEVLANGTRWAASFCIPLQYF